MHTSVINPVRVRTLLISALDLFSKGSEDGKFWVQGVEKTSTPILGSRHGFCSIGAIRNVPGFKSAEYEAAELALARMIARHSAIAEYDEIDLGDYPDLAEEVIVNANDAEETRFEDIRSWFTKAMSFVKK